MAWVRPRFCWSVRPAYHWIVMFGMLGVLRARNTRSLSRLRQPLDLSAPETADEVVVDHPGRLHERVADRRAHEGEAARLEIPAHRMRDLGRRRHPAPLPRPILDGPAVDPPPEAPGEQGRPSPHREQRARVRAAGRGLA